MKLKGIRTIALLLVGLVLVVGSIAGTAAVRAGEVPRTDVYWWEDCRWKKSTEDLGPYYLNQAKELWLFIFDHYFGMDISRLTFYELEALGNETGHELLAEKVARHWKGPVVEKAIVELEPLLPQPDVYWWYIVGDPEAKVEWIMEQVAEAKGMSPDDVRTRFGKLFPGVDLWSMTFDEFDQFLRDMPRPPLVALRPVCFDELRERPLIMGLFGTVPELSTEEELEEFNHKLEKVLDAALPILRQLPRCEFAFEGLVVSRGAISIAVGCLDFPMEEVYEIIADKAEMFGIEDIPVTFSDGRGSGLDALPPYAGPLGSSSSGWEAPWNEPFGGCPDSRIPGAVKVTCPAGGSSTASFSVRQFT